MELADQGHSLYVVIESQRDCAHPLFGHHLHTIEIRREDSLDVLRIHRVDPRSAQQLLHERGAIVVHDLKEELENLHCPGVLESLQQHVQAKRPL